MRPLEPWTIYSQNLDIINELGPHLAASLKRYNNYILFIINKIIINFSIVIWNSKYRIFPPCVWHLKGVTKTFLPKEWLRVCVWQSNIKEGFFFVLIPRCFIFFVKGVPWSLPLLSHIYIIPIFLIRFFPKAIFPLQFV